MIASEKVMCPAMAALEGQKKRKRVKPDRPTLERIPEPTGDGDSKFARALGSSDWQTREKGLQALTRWLSLRQDMSEDDMKKIWKGLFYAFWHSDKGPVQVLPRSPLPSPIASCTAAAAACHCYYFEMRSTLTSRRA